jgi:thioredoxin reductase
MRHEEVVIIGGGPAGIAAAIQLKRYQIDPLLFERQRIGGLLHNANLVENLPGFPQGLPGPELVHLFQSHLQSADVRVIFQEVQQLSYQNDYFYLQTSGGVVKTSYVIIASGTKPRQFPYLKIPPAFRDKVFYEVVPLLMESDKQMVIVGAGDAAFDYALNLSRQNQVTILNRGSQSKCLPLLWERAHKTAQIQYLENTHIQQLLSSSNGKMLIQCTSPQGNIHLEADFLIGAIGREPNLDFLTQDLITRKKTLLDRGLLHFIGDVKNGIYRQTAIAIGDGIHAAMRIQQTMKEC